LNEQNQTYFRLHSPLTNSDSFIERMGLTAESDGLSRIAGRLFGALLLDSEPRSLDELAEQLGVSKASVSTEARRLLDRGVAERIGKLGDRRDYYALTPDFFAQIVRFRLSRWSGLHRLVKEMQGANADLPKNVRDRFAYIEEVQAFVLAHAEDALAEWTLRAQRATPVPRERPKGSKERTPAKAAKRHVPRERLG
jgi:DNA-binding transcriptional regulator GbsR (MarR family)